LLDCVVRHWRREGIVGEYAEDPPDGFQIAENDDGRWAVRYRMAEISWRHLFTHLRLLWTGTAALVVVIGAAGFGACGVMDYLLLLIGGLALAAQILLAGFMAWHLYSVAAFTFGPDELVVECSLLGFRRRRVFRRAEVRAVVQAKREGEDQLPIAELVVVGGDRITVLWRRPISASDWLGPVIARWAGVPFQPWVPAERKSVESGSAPASGSAG
jgi:hypothetical protein